MTGLPLIPPDEQSMTSTPLAFTNLDRITLLSGSHPASSSTDNLMNKGLLSGQFRRTSSTISVANLILFSSDPPYMSFL